jgi:hypothetical protein
MEQAALAEGTRKAYGSGIACWVEFARACGHDSNAVPKEERMCAFAAWMAEEGKGKEGKGTAR